jgi:hypothetical protein
MKHIAYLILVIGVFTQFDLSAQGEGITVNIDKNGRLSLNPNTNRKVDNHRLIVSDELYFESQQKVIQSINKKWGELLDSLLLEGVDCIDETSKTLLPDLNKSDIKTFVTKNKGKQKLIPSQIDTLLKKDKIEFDIYVNNLVYQSVESELKEVESELLTFTINNNLPINDMRVFKSILDGKIDYFDCCDPRKFDIETLKSKIKSLSTPTDKSKSLIISLLKHSFLYYLKNGQLSNHEKITKIEAEIVNLKNKLSKVKERILNNHNEKSKNPLKTKDEWKSFAYETINNDSLVKKINQKIEEDERVLENYRLQEKSRPIWFENIMVQRVSLLMRKDNRNNYYFDFESGKTIEKNHEPLPKHMYFTNKDTIITFFLNHNEDGFTIDTTIGQVTKENTVLFDVIEEVPGLSDLLQFVGGIKLPDLLPKGVGKVVEMNEDKIISSNTRKISQNKNELDYLNQMFKNNKNIFLKGSDRYEIFIDSIGDTLFIKLDLKSIVEKELEIKSLEKENETLKLKKKLKAQNKIYLDKTCCCTKECKFDSSICVNDVKYTVPNEFYTINFVGKSNHCLSPCEMLLINLFNGFNINVLAPNRAKIEEYAKQSIFYSNSRVFSMQGLGAQQVNFVLKNKDNVKSKTSIANIYISKRYKITAGIGPAFNTGLPYQNVLDPTSGTFSRDYLPNIKLTGGLKWFPFGTTIKQTILSRKLGNNKYGYLNKRKANYATKLFVYGGFTISDKPYEHLYLGLGIEPVPGFAIMGFNRVSWVNKYRVDDGVIVQTMGYSGLFNPRQYGISILIDPKIAVNLFKK